MKLLTVIYILCILQPACAQGEKYTLVFLTKKSDIQKLPKEQLDKIMEGHMANINKLAQEGKLLAAGPFDGGGGIFILRTTAIEEAKTWLSTDPGIQANRWDVELLPYQPRIGGACLVSEPYEMVKYSLIRFDAVISKPTASTYPEIIRKHNEYLSKLAATGNIVAEGIFDHFDGGILIMKGDIQSDVFESDPGVREGLLQLIIKKLNIAKGSFCEQ